MSGDNPGSPSASTPRLFRGKPLRRMHVMVKPTGALCNLDCSYCYYLSKQELLGKSEQWRISDEVLETFIRQYFEGQNHKEVVFSWQGGEPTLLGVDFFRKVVELEKKYCPPHVRCENDLQTNGTILDDAWCEFLYEENFLVGLSIDGPRHLHDAFRKDKSGKGSFDRGFRAAKLLRKHKVNFATLSCVNSVTAKHPLEVYRFLRDEVGSKRVQFIPIVEPIGFRQVAPQRWDERFMPLVGSPRARPGTEGSVLEDWSVDPDDWGDFLCRVFDEKAPPVGAFWSLTIYNAGDKMLVENSINRYKVGSDTPGFKVNSDGSFTISIQHDEPQGPDKANWLPAPKGDFNLFLRLYQPNEEILSGAYPLPQLNKVKESVI